jgi:hypothetical protein
VRIEVVGAGLQRKRTETNDGVESDAAFEWLIARLKRAVLGSTRRASFRQLTANAGTPVPATQLLFELVRFALALAQETDGAFDPDGRRSHGAAAGFDRELQHGPALSEPGSRRARIGELSRRRPRRTRPNDHGCCRARSSTSARSPKGSRSTWPRASSPRLREISPIDAGGDLYLAGRKTPPASHGRSAIRHPRDEHKLIDTMRSSEYRGLHVRATTSDASRATHPASIAIAGPFTSSMRRTGMSRRRAASVTVGRHVSNGRRRPLATAAFRSGSNARHRATRATWV